MANSNFRIVQDLVAGLTPGFSIADRARCMKRGEQGRPIDTADIRRYWTPVFTPVRSHRRMCHCGHPLDYCYTIMRKDRASIRIYGIGIECIKRLFGLIDAQMQAGRAHEFIMWATSQADYVPTPKDIKKENGFTPAALTVLWYAHMLHEREVDFFTRCHAVRTVHFDATTKEALMKEFKAYAKYALERPVQLF
mgnify:CR=1 FL=1